MQNDLQPVVGHRFKFRADPMPHWNGVTECEVLTVEPNKRLSYTWKASGGEAANGLKPIVTWSLTRTAGGVLVRMEQSGFRPEEERNDRGCPIRLAALFRRAAVRGRKLGGKRVLNVLPPPGRL
jgi:uncharacterized protein YndB with AHSA1/START domain